VNPKYVRLYVGIPREELQADAAGVLIVRKGRGLEAGVLVVLLETGLEKPGFFFKPIPVGFLGFLVFLIYLPRRESF
jgi:hypothetical protein